MKSTARRARRKSSRKLTWLFRSIVSVIVATTLFLSQRRIVQSYVQHYSNSVTSVKRRVGNVATRTSLNWEEANATYDPTKGISVDTVCIEWEINTDSWWTHHVEWAQGPENETHYCYDRIRDTEKSKFLQDLYDVQFKGNCSEMITRRMFSSGWGCDFLNVQDGILYAAIESHQPVQFYGDWHYAAGKNGELKPACRKKNQDCYFLQLSRCEPQPDNIVEREPKNSYTGNDKEVYQLRGGWAYEYATRPQGWLRREVYDYSQTLSLATPCTVIHVRRSDVVLHGDVSRKYHVIKEYMDLGDSNIANNIFLLTDDQNAVAEALVQYPQYTWVYFDRKRHRGAEGGWENQFPSNDPKHEVIVILSTFQLARQCDTFIHSFSSFSSYIWKEMKYSNNSKRISIDGEYENLFGESFHKLFNPKHAESVKVSKAKWQ